MSTENFDTDSFDTDYFVSEFEQYEDTDTVG
jgi:hypothetical protein